MAPTFKVIEELEDSYKRTVEIAGTRYQATITVNRQRPTRSVSLTADALDPPEEEASTIRLEVPMTDLQAWQDFLTETFGAGLSLVGLSAPASIDPAEPPPAPAATPSQPRPSERTVDHDVGGGHELLTEQPAQEDPHQIQAPPVDAHQVAPASADPLALEGEEPPPTEQPSAYGTAGGVRQDAGLNAEDRLTVKQIIDRAGPEAVKQLVDDELQGTAAGESGGQQQLDEEPERERSFQ